MKKEKKVKTYQRRTKSGKIVTVKAHTAKYDAAEEMKKAAKKKGAGDELLKKKTEVSKNPLGFSEDDYKEWYHWDAENDANNEAALRVEKALIKQMGKRAYNKYFDDMSNSYSARGHKKAHQALLDNYSTKGSKQNATTQTTTKEKGSKDLKNDFMNSSISSRSLLRRSKGLDKIDNSLYKTLTKFTNGRDENVSIKDVDEYIRREGTTPDVTNWGIFKLKLYDEFLKERKGKSNTPTSKNAEAPKKPKGQDLSNVKKGTSNKETAASLRKRANEMAAHEKKAKITEKVGKGFKTIKNAQLNNPPLGSRSGVLRGNVYISADGKTAYYEDPFNKGNLKKARTALIKRLTEKKK